MNKTLIYFSVPELIVIMSLILASMIGIIICLNSNCKKREKIGFDDASKNAIDAYILYCRNEALINYMKERERRIEYKRNNPDSHILYYECSVSDALNNLDIFLDEIQKIENPYKFMVYYYKNLPSIMSSFVSSFESGSIASEKLTREQKIAYMNTLERFCLDIDSIKEAESILFSKNRGEY